MCTEYSDASKNVCYSCIANWSKASSVFGLERTSHCHSDYQYCASDYSCKMQQTSGSSCDGNNFMCNTGLCNKNTMKCESCN